MRTTATFGLIPARRDVAAPGGFTTGLREDGTTKSEAAFWEFTTAGEPLLPALSARAGEDLDVAGVIQDAWPIESVEAIDRLLGEAPGDLPDGRTALYICPECGDLGCGAVTARLSVEAGVVTWADVGWQTDYDDGAGSGHVEQGSAWADVRFDRRSYESVLLAQRERLVPLTVNFEYPYQRRRRERRQALLRFISGRWLRGPSG